MTKGDLPLSKSPLLIDTTSTRGGEASPPRVRWDGVARAGYIVALLLVVVPLVDVAVRGWPPRPASETWRFGTSGIALGSLVSALLGTYLAIAIATLQGQPRVLRVLAALVVLGGVALLGGLVLFALDYLQIRATIRPEMKSALDLNTWKAALIGLGTAIGALWVGIAGWRAAARRPGAPA